MILIKLLITASVVAVLIAAQLLLADTTCLYWGLLCCFAGAGLMALWNVKRKEQ